MIEIWNARYAENEFIYGKEPNEFFKKNIDILNPKTLLLPAEGEGRNAVYAAGKGWNVTAFDQSKEAQKKAYLLAKEKKVSIDYYICDIMNFNVDILFDVIGIFYLHLPNEIKKSTFDKIFSHLKPGGMVILEVFHKEQIKNTSGGPKTIDLLYDIDEINYFLKGFNKTVVTKENIFLNEGTLHNGNAEVIRALAY